VAYKFNGEKLTFAFYSCILDKTIGLKVVDKPNTLNKIDVELT